MCQMQTDEPSGRELSCLPQQLGFDGRPPQRRPPSRQPSMVLAPCQHGPSASATNTCAEGTSRGCPRKREGAYTGDSEAMPGCSLCAGASLQALSLKEQACRQVCSYRLLNCSQGERYNALALSQQGSARPVHAGFQQWLPHPASASHAARSALRAARPLAATLARALLLLVELGFAGLKQRVHHHIVVHVIAAGGLRAGWVEARSGSGGREHTREHGRRRIWSQGRWQRHMGGEAPVVIWERHASCSVASSSRQCHNEWQRAPSLAGAQQPGGHHAAAAPPCQADSYRHTGEAGGPPTMRASGPCTPGACRLDAHLRDMASFLSFAKASLRATTPRFEHL